MKFNVTVSVKPYVKRFLENNYGNPVDFRNHPRENEMFKRMLKKPNLDNEHKYKTELCSHISTVEITITDRDFYRHGWKLSKTDIISFGKHFEKNAKWLMRSVVGIYVSFGMPLHMAIQKFQTKFSMEEDYWSFESIKKEFYRFNNDNEIDCKEYAFQHLERLVLVNLTKTGSITKDLLQNHEK